MHNAQAWKSMLDERELSAQVSTALTTGMTLSWKSVQRLGNSSRCCPHLQCHFICEHHPESGPNVTWTEAKWKSVLRSWTSLHLDQRGEGEASFSWFPLMYGDTLLTMNLATCTSGMDPSVLKYKF